VYCRAQLIKENVWSAVVTDRPASGSDSKGNFVADAWDIMNESALATTQMSVRPVHQHSVTAINTAKDEWDALKDICKARDSAQLRQLMHQLNNLKKVGDENIINDTSRAKGLRQELAMLGNQFVENTLVLQTLSGIPVEYDMIRTVLKTIDGRRNLADVSAKLLRVEQRGIRGRSSSTTGVESQAFASLATKKSWDKKAVVYYFCDKKGHMKRDYLKMKADDSKGNRKPSGGRRDGDGGGGTPPCVALAYARSVGHAGEHKTPENTSRLSTWVLNSGATNHMAARAHELRPLEHPLSEFNRGDSVLAALQLVQRPPHLDEASQRCLHRLALLAPDRVPRALLRPAGGTRKLAALSMVSYPAPRLVSVHRLVQQVARDAMTPSKVHCVATDLLATLCALTKGFNATERAAWAFMQSVVAHAEAVYRNYPVPPSEDTSAGHSEGWRTPAGRLAEHSLRCGQDYPAAERWARRSLHYADNRQARWTLAAALRAGAEVDKVELDISAQYTRI